MSKGCMVAYGNVNEWRAAVCLRKLYEGTVLVFVFWDWGKPQKTLVITTCFGADIHTRVFWKGQQVCYLLHCDVWYTLLNMVIQLESSLETWSFESFRVLWKCTVAMGLGGIGSKVNRCETPQDTIQWWSCVIPLWNLWVPWQQGISAPWTECEFIFREVTNTWGVVTTGIRRPAMLLFLYLLRNMIQIGRSWNLIQFDLKYTSSFLRSEVFLI